MVEVKEHIVKVLISVSDWLDLVEVRWNVADLIEVLRAHLTDMEVDHMAVVGIYFEELIFGQVICIKPMLDVHVLVR